MLHVVFHLDETGLVQDILRLAAPFGVVSDVDLTQADLEGDHEFLELLPAHDTILVLIDFREETGHIFVGD